MSLQKKIKEINKIKLLGVFFVAVSNVVFATDFQFDEINLSGTACKQQNTSIVRSIDQQTVSILFDQFSVEVPNINNDNDNDELFSRSDRFNNERMDYKTCNMFFNAQINEGERVAFLEISVDYRGLVIVEGDAIARFKAFLNSWDGPRKSNRKDKEQFINEVWMKRDSDFKEIDQDIKISQNKIVGINSPCSIQGDRKLKFNIKTSVMAHLPRRANLEGNYVLLQVDSADIQGSLKVKIHTQKCMGTMPTTRPMVRPAIRPTTRPMVRPAIRPTSRPIIRPATRRGTRPMERI